MVEKNFKKACIIPLTETWVNESVPDSKIYLDNLNIFRADRRSESGKEWGGQVYTVPALSIVLSVKEANVCS